MLLHTSDAPRHARMFELLRQKEQAALTTERLHDAIRLEGSVDIAQQFKKDALASFDVPQTSESSSRLF